MRVAINGLGRIGRALFRILLEQDGIELVAANDIAEPEDLLYLIKHDSIYGQLDKEIKLLPEEGFQTEKGKIKIFKEKDPENLPWGKLQIDVVLESSGFFLKRELASKHLNSGAKKVFLSAPAKSEDIPFVVPGVNSAPRDERIISVASCTTNCIAPVIEVLNRKFGVKKAALNTVHAYTSTQALVDKPDHKDPRRGRAAATNLVPTSTGAAIAATKVITELEGRFDGLAIRAPLPTVSIADITALLGRETSISEINEVFQVESESERYKNILGVTHEPMVSSDFIEDPRASVVDCQLTQVIDRDLVKVMIWYDNEWGYSNQMIREVLNWSK